MALYQERLGVLAAPRMVRSTFLKARLRSAVPKKIFINNTFSEHSRDTIN
jgi:hypothetical protein